MLTDYAAVVGFLSLLLLLVGGALLLGRRGGYASLACAC